jgi:hypothetical protein
MNVMKYKALSVLRLLLGLMLFAAGVSPDGGLGFVVQQIGAIGARQWLGLMASSFVSNAPVIAPVSQRLTHVFQRRVGAPAAGWDSPGDLTA